MFEWFLVDDMCQLQWSFCLASFPQLICECNLPTCPHHLDRVIFGSRTLAFVNSHLKVYYDFQDSSFDEILIKSKFIRKITVNTVKKLNNPEPVGATNTLHTHREHQSQRQPCGD